MKRWLISLDPLDQTISPFLHDPALLLPSQLRNGNQQA
jgi:hypothetical protein